MTRLLQILLLVLGVTALPLASWADEVFTAPDGSAYPPDVQATLGQAKAAYDAGKFERAHDLWLPLAEAGNAEAQYRVGRLHDVGEGRPRNGERAVKWYGLASDQQHMSATHNLALLFHKGEIVEQNHKAATQLYQRNAKQGDAESQVGFGIQLLAGVAIPRRKIEGLAWLYLARDQGSQAAIPAIEYFEPFLSAEEILAAQRLVSDLL